MCFWQFTCKGKNAETDIGPLNFGRISENLGACRDIDAEYRTCHIVTYNESISINIISNCYHLMRGSIFVNKRTRQLMVLDRISRTTKECDNVTGECMGTNDAGVIVFKTIPHFRDQILFNKRRILSVSKRLESILMQLQSKDWQSNKRP